jgi:integrating conjugative element protein (TIGR03757 family)
VNSIQIQPFNTPLIAVIILMTVSAICYGESENKHNAPLIEIFTASPFVINEQGILQLRDKGEEEYKLYSVDRIEHLQQRLSRDLPRDPAQAKQAVLKRFQSMDADLSRQLENAAKGLAKALQYGVDRYPAVVFDGEAVIYGVTDLDVAASHYRRWQAQASE